MTGWGGAESWAWTDKQHEFLMLQVSVGKETLP